MKRYGNWRRAAALLGALLLAAGCIENDLPLPAITVNVASVRGEGFTLKEIDVVNRTVTLTLDERTDIRNVRIDSVGYAVVPHNVGGSLDLGEALRSVTSTVSFPATFDLRGPIEMQLSLYADFDWTIRAEQQIDRRFRVAGQIGDAVFDLVNHTATAYVAKNADRSRVTIEELRLEPDGITTYYPTVEELSQKDFTETMRLVNVTCHGRTEQWMIYILPTELNVEMTAPPQEHAWPGVIWLYGAGVEGMERGFRYRVQGEAQWQELPASQITFSGGSFRGYLNRTPDTAYEFTAYCGGDETQIYPVEAEPAPPVLQNGGFEEWSTSEKGIVYPYAAGAEPYWSSGNPGASIANETLTEPCDPRPGSPGKYGAHLKSKFANVMGIGKFAAGNIFLGNYVATDGTNGLLVFGRRFTARPTALRVWVKFKGGTIEYAGKNTPAGVGIGSPDNGSIYVALGTWTKEEYGMVPASVPTYGGTMLGTDDSPICIATREIGSLFKPNTPAVVGYGEINLVEDIDEWTQITIPIKYTATNIVPTNISIVCASSRWGDYFTGSPRCEMWLDDLELVYEYVEDVLQ